MPRLPRQTLARLRHVTVRDPDMDIAWFPDFFVIGPQRTGSTWLYDCMRHHPRIGLSKGKELYYFSTLARPQHPCFRSTDLDDYRMEFTFSPEELAARSEECRRACGEDFDPLVWGEATASYAVEVDESVMHDILLLNPGIKAILTVRDPVERVWSHAKKDVARETGRSVDEVPDEDFLEFFRNPYQAACGRYTGIIDFWSRSLREGHLLIVRFADVGARPDGLLREVYRFLGVPDDDRYVPAMALEKVDATTAEPVPDRFRAAIEDILGDDLVRQRERYGWDWRNQR